jgi:MtrB/PioB family decaheme-associated outer membrane protein
VKRFLCTAAALALLAPAAVLAQGDGRIQTSSGFTAGVQQDEISNDSSKFNEYRDIRDGFYLYDLNFEAVDTETGLFLDLRGKNLIRDDQTIDFGLGKYGLWKLDVNRNETPHNLSNKAMTPFNHQGDGYLAVPALVPIREQGTVSLVPTAPEMAVNDALIADYLLTDGVLHKVDLGTQRDKTSATLTISPLEFLKFRLTYSDERKDGNKISYGPIGDRPPRTLNVQFAEPIDYVTRELRAEADLDLDRFQARLAYHLSDFDNEIETLTWDNIFFSPEVGQDFAIEANGNRRVSALGQRALAPDNRYHNVSATFGVDLPLASRLAATAAYGWMKQDEKLLPYSAMSFVESAANLNPITGEVLNPDGLGWNDPARLARRNADAEINTKLFNVDYTINPVKRANLRAFFRYYDLDNETDSDQWRYVTQDTVGGSPNYRNLRINLPYAYEKQNYGLDASYSLAFWRTTLGLGYEREEFDRDFREADTDENIYRLSLRTQPTDRVLVRAKYLYGDREADGYDFNVTSQSYWYSFAQGSTEVDNPQFLFANHPDLRKFDVSDRERHQFDISATVTPVQSLDLTAAYHYRKDDFDSDVSPVAPLANVDPAILPNPADANALTPGLQLGLLEEERQNYSLDAYYAPSERWNFSFFANREVIESKIRGMVFNENQRREPSNAGIQDIRQLGPWTDADRLYTNKMEDRTNTFGAGYGFEIIPGKIKLSTDYTYSRGKVDWDYSGYGTQFEDTFQFAFSSPDTVRHNQYVLNASLEYQMVKNLTFGLHYLFDRFSIKDWMQEPNGPWVEEVGSEFFLRDTSQDNRWGNRLVNMGSTLGPSYEAHVGYLTMTYKF